MTSGTAVIAGYDIRTHLRDVSATVVFPKTVKTSYPKSLFPVHKVETTELQKHILKLMTVEMHKQL